MLIDGSNLALYGQNWAHGGFDFAQIGAAYDHCVAQYPALKPLVVRETTRGAYLLRSANPARTASHSAGVPQQCLRLGT